MASLESDLKMAQGKSEDPETVVVDFSDLGERILLREDEKGEKVFRVVDCQTGRAYTMKEFSVAVDSDLRVDMRREFDVMKRLSHPNLVKCYELFEIGDTVSLLLEDMGDGSLDRVDFTNLDNIARVAYQVLLGLDYLHMNRIPHGVVKPSNIFVNSSNEVKVLYFGKILFDKNLKLSEIGAPYDELHWDLWNLGFSILKLLKGSNRKFQGIAFTELWGFVECCMSKDLSWTAKTLLSHRFFRRQGITDLSKTGDKTEDSYKSKSLMLKQSSSAEKVKTEGGRSKCEPVAVKIGKAISKRIGDDVDRPNKIFKAFVDSKNLAMTSKDSTEKGHFGIHGQLEYPLRCIHHCFLFYPDCEFEKDKLIQMWIAEECIEVEGIERMEEFASRYFDALVKDEIIIPTGFNRRYKERTYKVNTSQVLTAFHEQDDYLRIDGGKFGENSGDALHLLWKCKRLGQTLSHALKKFKQLRTLRVVEDRVLPMEQLPNDTFLGLKDLRSLDLSHGGIFELPISIGTLESLRYMDVSDTPIMQLPESTALLSHLQTLRLRDCSRLHALPKKFRNLKKLRHLDLNIVGQLRSMPKGMGNLTEIQTLKAFLVGKNDGCRIEELENMNEITGQFSIMGLENVANNEEAKKAKIADKKHIEELVLRWNELASSPCVDTTEILECLQPHFHLKELMIICFRGSKLPTWISNPSYTNLSSITLIKCMDCHLLPSLGELPSLKILHIVEMENVRVIGASFCRSTGNEKPGAFLKLEQLKLEKMLNLEEWTGIEEGDLPCLRHICIRSCPKLVALPSMSHLYSLQHLELCICVQLASLPEGMLPDSVESLIIKDCPNVRERCLKDEGQDWFKIASIKKIWIDLDKLSLD